MYTTKNFPSKKAFKEAVAAYHTLSPIDGQRMHAAVRYWQPGPFGGNEPQSGTVYFEGPHYPAPHRWYAQATVENGIVIKVK